MPKRAGSNRQAAIFGRQSGTCLAVRHPWPVAGKWPVAGSKTTAQFCTFARTLDASRSVRCECCGGGHQFYVGQGKALT